MEDDLRCRVEWLQFNKREGGKPGCPDGAEGPAWPTAARTVKCVRKQYVGNSLMHMRNHRRKARD